MTALFIALALAVPEVLVTDAGKRAFLESLAALPTRGEFFTEEAIRKAVPRLPVLLALTEKDLGGRDIYPFLALSRGLLDHGSHREYGVRHFGKIRHPVIKLFWGAVLFDEDVPSPEIVDFLRVSLRSDRENLSQILGPNFDDFVKRLDAYKPQSQHQNESRSSALDRSEP